MRAVRDLLRIVRLAASPRTRSAWGLQTHVFIAQWALAAVPFADPRLRAAALRLPQPRARRRLPARPRARRAHARPRARSAARTSGRTLRRLAAGRCDEERAIAVGYASHLLADVIAHNRFVPEHEHRILDVPHVTHALCEWAMDEHLSRGLTRAAGGLALRSDRRACRRRRRRVRLPRGGGAARDPLPARAPSGCCASRACRWSAGGVLRAVLCRRRAALRRLHRRRGGAGAAHRRRAAGRGAALGSRAGARRRRWRKRRRPPVDRRRDPGLVEAPEPGRRPSTSLCGASPGCTSPRSAASCSGSPAIYVAGCALPLVPADDRRAAPVPARHAGSSRIVVGRSVATVAELAFAAQWALLMHEAGARARRAAGARR